MGKHNQSKEGERTRSKHASKHKHSHKHKKIKEDMEKDKSVPKGLEVHSANAWEDVKFESNAKREKFLRLMGAQRQRKHMGSVHIGEKSVAHTRAGVGVEELGINLEKQFSEGLEHKAPWKRHAGLGCVGEGSSPVPQNRLDEEGKQQTSCLGGKYMNFVKSSNK